MKSIIYILFFYILAESIICIALFAFKKGVQIVIISQFWVVSVIIVLLYAYIYYQIRFMFIKQIEQPNLTTNARQKINKTQWQLLAMFIMICQRYAIEFLSSMILPDDSMPNVISSTITYTVINCVSISLYFIAYCLTLFIIVRTQDKDTVEDSKTPMS